LPLVADLLGLGLIAAGTTWTVPRDWTLEKVLFAHYPGPVVYATGAYLLGEPGPPKHTVTLRRLMQPGETITAPEGCEIAAEQHEERPQQEKGP
jgi:hypothetical protein